MYNKGVQKECLSVSEHAAYLSGQVGSLGLHQLCLSITLVLVGCSHFVIQLLQVI